ncbi:MAG TPA: adenylate/guanylate cyclase domain-containing protein [Bryobacteraceae bacterium]|nr:adenylate/guanylate cyclase domain-containing protein [Bryobacteraceae bacterium]
MILAIAGFAFLATTVSGLWQYEAGKSIIHRKIVDGLDEVGSIIAAHLADMLKIEADELSTYTKYLPEPVAANRGRLAASLHFMDLLNEEILQINVFGSGGAELSSSNTKHAAEPVDHTAVAWALDGKRYISDAYWSGADSRYVLIMAVPIAGPNGQAAGALTIRYDLQAELSGLIRSTRSSQDGYAVIANHAGRILAHPDSRRIGDDISTSAAFEQGREENKGWMTAINKSGQNRLFAYQSLPSPATINPQNWVLLTEMDEDQAIAPIRDLRLTFLLSLVLLTVAGVLIARRVAVSISAPMQQLVELAGTIQRGVLTARTTLSGRDEVGQLALALNEMTRGLNERDRIRELFGRYVATQVSDRILKGEISLGGESRQVTILFSDIRGFTEMSEQMTPAQVVAFLNDYFSEMVEAVFEQNGVLDKFLGDGMMAVFGSMGDMPDHPRRAVLAALRMKALLSKINGDRAILGKPPINIGIGIHTDDVIVGNIGTRKRLEYTVIGDGVNTCSRVEALNKELGTTILITGTTWEAVKNDFVCRPMPEHELRGKKKKLPCYEVVSVKSPGNAGEDQHASAAPATV